jgi:hypothetical protein
VDGAATGVTVWLDYPPAPLLDEAVPLVRFWLAEWSDFGAVTVALGAPPPGSPDVCVTVDPGTAGDVAAARLLLLRAVIDAAGSRAVQTSPAPATSSPGDLEPFGAGEMAVFARLDGGPDLRDRLDGALETALDGEALLQDSTVLDGTVGQWVIGRASGEA